MTWSRFRHGSIGWVGLIVLGIVSAFASAARAQELQQLREQWSAHMAAGRYGQAVAVGRQMVEISDRDFRDEPLAAASALNYLAVAYNADEHNAEAEPLFRRALAIFEAHPDTEMQNVATGYNNLASVIDAQGRFAEAEPLYNKALQLRIKLFGPDSDEAAGCYNNIGKLYSNQNRYAEAEPLLERAIAIWTQKKGPRDPSVANATEILAGVKYRRGRYAEAEQLYQKGLSIRAEAQGRKHPRYVDGLFGLGELYQGLGRYDEAIRTFQEGLAILEDAFGPEHPAICGTLSRMGETYQYQGHYAEAERLMLRANAIREKAPEQDPAGLASQLNSLGLLYNAEGRYAEAETLLRRALEIMARIYGRDHRNVASGYNNLAAIFRDQGRYPDAERLYKTSLEIMHKVLDPDHPNIAATLNNLGLIAQYQGRLADAQSYFSTALELRTKVLGADHHVVAIQLDNLATVYWQQGRYAEAERLNRRSLAILEKQLGPDHLDVAKTLNNLATALISLHNEDQAEALLTRSIGILERMNASPRDQYRPYRLRAAIAWRAGRREAAIADLTRAMDLAETMHARGSGIDFERAAFFSGFSDAYEQMVAWQGERGDVAAVYQAMERGRSRTLLDQMQLRGVDLLAGLPGEQANPLRRRQADALARIAGLERRAQQLHLQPGLTAAERKSQDAALREELAEARRQAIAAARDIRNASPAYRLARAHDQKPVELEPLRISVGNSLLLEYFVGDENSYVLVIPPRGAGARLEKITLDPDQARTLGVEPGPLAADRLQAILSGAKGRGLMARIADPTEAVPVTAQLADERGKGAKARQPAAEQAIAAIPQLAALWQVLVPLPERKAIEQGRTERLVIIPDGPLALLPFEALVIEQTKEPTFLLDAGPPTAYGPSATVLYNLAERPGAKPTADRAPVLAVGDPAYGTTGAEDPTPTTTLAALTSRSRYGNAGGSLSRLPYSGIEAQWVVKQFNDAGIDASSFTGATATERGVRYWCSGRRILHLACHGLADHQFGNFFGALALTPGPKGSLDPSDDGFLTLPEIYELDLKGFELAILSACQTNYGPQQKGEGTWALSRGFLVAGARRVMASNWLVDDEAAATLVNYFCAGLARAEKAGKPVDYAGALQAAKRLVRQQDKWKNPYYWASMVLIGPQ